MPIFSDLTQKSLYTQKPKPTKSVGVPAPKSVGLLSATSKYIVPTEVGTPKTSTKIFATAPEAEQASKEVKRIAEVSAGTLKELSTVPVLARLATSFAQDVYGGATGKEVKPYRPTSSAGRFLFEAPTFSMEDENRGVVPVSQQAKESRVLGEQIAEQRFGAGATGQKAGGLLSSLIFLPALSALEVSPGIGAEARGVKTLAGKLAKKGIGEIAESAAETGAASVLRDVVGGIDSSAAKIVPPEVPIDPGSFDPVKYAKDQIAAREVARKGVEPTLGERASSFYREAKTKVVDANAPIEDVLADAQKTGGFTLKPEEDFADKIARVQRAPTLAGQFVKDNGLDVVIKEVDDLDLLDQYLIAKQAEDVAAQGFKTGRNIQADRALIESVKDTYEPYAQRVYKYSQNLLDYVTDSGLISKETRDTLRKTYPNYIPVNRIFTEAEQAGQRTGSSATASLSKQTVVQKLKGSEREIESPFASLLAKTNDAFTQGEKNVAARTLVGYEKLPGNPFDLVPLSTKEMADKRKVLRESLDVLFKERDGFYSDILLKKKQIRSKDTQLRRIGRQMDEVTNEAALRAAEDLPTTNVQAQISKDRNLQAIQKKVVDSESEMRDLLDEAMTISSEGASQKEINDILDRVTQRERRIFALEGKINKIDVEPRLNNLISSQEKKQASSQAKNVEGILDKGVSLERKSYKVEAKKAVLSNEVKELNTLVDDRRSDIKALRELIDESKKVKPTAGEGTISFFNDGFKEVWQTRPEIANAAKNLNVYQLGLLEKIFAYPVRLFKVGTTGANLPFVGANVLKDQAFAFVTSNNSLRTSAANPAVFVKALLTAVKHNDTYDEMVRAAGAGTSFDVRRKFIPETIESIRSQRSKGARAKYLVTHPSQLFRAVEDVISRSEELTRAQQFIGTKEANIKAGMPEAQATILAAKAARENTADFFRRGEWGAVLSGVFSYLNSGIQGSRSLVRAFSRDPKGTTAKLVTAVFLPVAAATAWNVSDPARKAAYADIADYEKENNLIFVPPNPTKDEDGNWNVIKVPLPPGLSNLSAPVRIGIEQSQDVNELTAKDIVSAISGGFTPVDVTEPGKLLSTFTPQLLRPTLEAQTNTDLFTGLPQVPKNLENLSPEMQVKQNTSGTARKVGGLLEASPIKVEKFIKGTFGEVGLQGLNALDRALAGMDIIPKEQVGGRSITEGFERRFTKASGGQGDRETINDLSGIIRKQGDERMRTRLEAEKIYEDIKKMPAKDANAKIAELYKVNRPLHDKLVDVYNEEKLNLTYADKLLNQLGVENGERARYIYGRIKEKKTLQEKNQYLQELHDKKIISSRVRKQLQFLLSND